MEKERIESPDARPCYVYVLWGEGTNHIKIGHAYDVEARRATLQTGSPHKLRTLMAISLPNAKEASDMEQRLHIRFSAIHTHLEWFDLPTDTAKAMEILAQITGATQAWDRPNAFVGIPPRAPSPYEFLVEDIVRVLQRASRQLSLMDFLEYIRCYWPHGNGGDIWRVLEHLVRHGRIQTRSPSDRIHGDWYWYDRLLDTSDVPLHTKPDWLYKARDSYMTPRTNEMTHEQIDQEIDAFFRKREEPV